MSKAPKKIQKEMANVYEKAWNDVVAGLSPYKRNIVIEGFDVVDGHHVYHNRADREIARSVVQEARIRADEIIDIKFSGKY
jgi:hypothetical protein